MGEDYDDRNRVVGRLKLKMHNKMYDLIVAEEEEEEEKKGEEECALYLKKIMS